MKTIYVILICLLHLQGKAQRVTIVPGEISKKLYAEIYFVGDSAVQSINNGVAYVKLTHWNKNLDSSKFIISDQLNDQIIINRLGRYQILASSSSSAGTANVDFEFTICADGVPLPNIYSWRKMQTAHDKGTGILQGTYNAKTKPICIDVRARHNKGAPVNFIVFKSNLNVTYIGD